MTAPASRFLWSFCVVAVTTGVLVYTDDAVAFFLLLLLLVDSTT